MEIYFHLNLRHLRKTQNVEREQIATEIGVSLSNISNWERAKYLPKVEDVVKLANFFGVTLDDLLLKNIGEAESMVKEKSEPYSTISEQNSQEINGLQIRVSALEAWKALVDKSLNL